MSKRFAPLAILLGFYVVLVALATRRHLWHDELYTFYICSASSLGEFWKCIQLDNHPPLYYVLARVAMSVLGRTAFAVRLPAMIGLGVASLCLYLLVQKRFRSVGYSAMAVLVFWSTNAFYFAAEARPYGLVLAFFGLAMLAWWQGRALALAAAVAGMMLTHFFAVFFLTPFLMAELGRFTQTRKVDWPVMSALLSPCVIPFFFLKLHSGEVFPPAFQAGVRKMASYYYWSLREEGWLLAVGFFAAVLIYRLAAREKPAGPPKYSVVEASFVAGLLLLPIVINGVLMFRHGAFFTRYSIPTLFAFPMVFVVVLAYWTNVNRPAALALCAAVGAYMLWHEGRPLAKHSDFVRVYPDLPLVAASGLTFMEMDHEQPAATVGRLFYLTDMNLALSYAHATMLENLFETMRQCLPIRGHIEPFRMFVSEHHRFLVLGTPDYAEDWLLRYLTAQHAKLQMVGEFPSESKDSQLYLVDF
jgi:4-amino-4-deoxy-L-arabinose transferase-like glycosyltransferase